MRKCRNWQTSKTKDLVAIAVVWVQVPSSALKEKRIKPNGLVLFVLYGEESLAIKIQGLLAMNGSLHIFLILHNMYCLHNKKQITGVEPAFPAWEASVLPMNHICMRIL